MRSTSEDAHWPDAVRDLLVCAYLRTGLAQWLVPSGERRAVLTRWARLVLDDAADRGGVQASPDRRAVAVWLSGPSEPATGWWQRLGDATGRHQERFEALHRTLAIAAPVVRYHHLAYLCVAPGPAHRRKRHATTLLDAYLCRLDRAHLTGYVVVPNPALVPWFGRYRFLATGPPIRLGDRCPTLQPMAREPDLLRHRPDRRR